MRGKIVLMECTEKREIATQLLVVILEETVLYHQANKRCHTISIYLCVCICVCVCVLKAQHFGLHKCKKERKR